MNLGAGRIVPQDEVRIQEAIETGTFAKNPAFHQAIEDAQARGGALHLLGLLSEKSSHGSMDYVLELLKLARRKGCDRVFIHFITDGRSTQPGSAQASSAPLGRDWPSLGWAPSSPWWGGGWPWIEGETTKEKRSRYTERWSKVRGSRYRWVEPKRDKQKRNGPLPRATPLIYDVP